ncbi:MAG: adenylate kinase [Fimbriimonadaceae bacterium]|nr:adenylate kinase [Fimbriimonadaceae bacterium]
MAIRLVLIGPPGVGKGTQSKLLSELTGARPLSSGLIFRAEIEADTELGQLAKDYIDHGHLVPNGVTIQMMFKRLRQEETRQKGFILDGFPRTVRQAEALDEELDKEQVTLDGVISLQAPLDVIVHRLTGRLGCTKCGEIYHSVNHPPHREGLCDKCDGFLVVRGDDTPEAIRERLVVFEEATAPVLDYYAATGRLMAIDAGRESDEVGAELKQRLNLTCA